jgi:N-acyl amino acid synthase of PEP-CTERM/exosortase system
MENTLFENPSCIEVRRKISAIREQSGGGAHTDLKQDNQHGASNKVTQTLSADVTGTELLTRYNTYFFTQPANTRGLIDTSLAIRFQVYCLERGFEDPAQHADRLERDEFDISSIHSLIFHRPRAEAIGTVRLILSGAEADSLPIQRLLRENGRRAANYFPHATTAEVSRFSISNEFRRRSTDMQPQFTFDEIPGRLEIERRSNLPCLGLIQILLRQSIACGITHWAAVMEPKLLRMLAGMGIHFTSVGPLISHHGVRQPSYCHLPQMLETLRRERLEFWNIVTNAGELSLSDDHLPQRHAA